ncbi:MAG: YeeE/YedE family protein [Pseudolabrys sp.]
MIPVQHVVLVSGLLIGILFGSIGLLSGFCIVTGLRNAWTRADGRMIRSIALALAVAILGTQSLAAAGLVDLGKSIYLQPSFSAPLILIGGLLFGYGMVAANACASRAMILLGGGNLRSLVVIVTVAVTAQMTLKGLIAPARIAFLNWSQITLHQISLPALLSASGAGTSLATAVTALIVGGILLAYAFSYAPFRASRMLIGAGVGIGLLVCAGWLATGYLGADPFEPTPVGSLTFIAPLADSLQYVMLSTGSTLSFGVVLMAGVLLGSFVTALTTRRFHLEGYTSANHMLRSIGGAALMGSGGAMAYGCSIGQGLTGLSTLAFSSAIAAAGILIGGWAALRGPVRIPALASA